jgi:hypothetical protein
MAARHFPSRSHSFILLPLIAWTLSLPEASAFILPYSQRTRDYSSWTPASRGDTNTIGMAGATVALPMSISSAEINPAGFAMMTGTVSAQINTTNLDDSRLQKSGDPISSSQWGFAVSPEHCGFSISYYSPQTESGTYASPLTGDTARADVSIKELLFTAAHAFFKDALSVGASFEIAKAVREIDGASSNSFGPTYRLGALYRIPNHVLFGVSYAPELRIGPAPRPDDTPAILGFNRSVIRPSLLTLGTGWIPNRFFKFGLSVTYVGATENTALLYDQSIITGGTETWVPRLGVSYVIAEYTDFKIEAAAGSYYESSRLSNQSDRIHGTVGVEANPSFINLGAGFDISNGYRNYIVSAGIDIVRTARFFKIIPKESLEPYRGFFPRLTQLSPDGLPAGLTSDEHRRHEEQSVTEVGKIIGDVPENLAKKISGEKTTVEEKNPEEAQPAPKPKKKPRKKPVAP